MILLYTVYSKILSSQNRVALATLTSDFVLTKPLYTVYKNYVSDKSVGIVKREFRFQFHMAIFLERNF